MIWTQTFKVRFYRIKIFNNKLCLDEGTVAASASLITSNSTKLFFEDSLRSLNFRVSQFHEFTRGAFPIGDEEIGNYVEYLRDKIDSFE